MYEEFPGYQRKQIKISDYANTIQL